jgi:hypothetical protein
MMSDPRFEELELDSSLTQLLTTARDAPPDAPKIDTDRLFAQLETSLEKERSVAGWLRSRATRVRWAFALLAIFVSAGLGLATLRPDASVYPLWRLGLELATATLAMLFGLSFFLRPIHRPRLPVALTIVSGALLVILGLVQGALPAAHLAHTASLAGAGDDLVARAIGCLLFGAIIGLPAGLLIYGLDRRPRIGLLAGLIGGAAGLVGLHLHCPITHSAHLLAGHAPVPIVAGAVAFLISAAMRRFRHT